MRPARLLIIDDDRAIAQLTSIWMRKAGFQTQIAFDGAAGLAKAVKEPPDLVLLDIRMPGMDGFEVHSQMKGNARLADVPVIFLSANKHEEARRKVAASRAAAFIAKPYEPEDVAMTVRRVLRTGSIRSEEMCHEVRPPADDSHRG